MVVVISMICHGNRTDVYIFTIRNVFLVIDGGQRLIHPCEVSLHNYLSYQSNQDLILKISIIDSNGQKYINNCHLNLQ